MLNPGLLLLILFVGVPLIELYTMIEIGGEIGAFPTVFLVVFTALLGGLLVRMQGLSTLMRVRATMERGEVPAIEMLEGVVLMIAGVSLLLPGFITDAVGFLLLIPPLRRWLVRRWLKASGRVDVHATIVGESRRVDRPRIIDAEYRRDDD